MTVSQWAETYRYVSPERSAKPGRWDNTLTPYLVEPMDAVTLPGVREIIFVASAQVGKTEFCTNVVGYFIHIDPSPILYVCETEDKAKAFSKESLAPSIRDTPALAALVAEPRQRDSNNTIEEKSFPGGHFALGYATSAASLSSRPRRIVIEDERDAYKPTSEGDPSLLAEKRANTFKETKRILKVSTPRDRMENPPGTPPDEPRFSPIELEYQNSDRRRYFVPCPECDEYQVLAWPRVKWDEDPAAAYYVCVNGCLIEHDSKEEMLARGEWRAEAPFRGRAGFHINELYSPFVSWGEMAVSFLEAKKKPETLKVFVNTSLAEGWEDTQQLASVDDLKERAQKETGYPEGADVPDEVLVITAAADVQGDRIETEIVGWGLDDESFSLEYQVLPGDPSLPEVWKDLRDLWTAPLLRTDGTEMRIAAACVDSGGHHTEEVYEFCRKNAGRKWRAVKGANTPGKPLIAGRSLIHKPEGDVLLYMVGTETAKDTMARRLTIELPGPGYCHFPPHREEGYFKQLRAERATVRSGVRRWEKVRPSARNEALDLRVYNMAALAILNPNWRVLAAKARARYEPKPEPPAEGARERPPERPRRSGGGFVGGDGFGDFGGGGFVNNY